jgi:hypothetical protein
MNTNIVQFLTAEGILTKKIEVVFSLKTLSEYGMVVTRIEN